MTTKTIVGGGGNWVTDGTFSPSGVPVASDDILMDATSGNNTTANSFCRGVDCTGFVGTWTIGAFTTLTIGDGTASIFKLVPGMTLTIGSAGQFTFVSTALGNLITTAGKTITTQLTFNGAGGGWVFQDGVTSTNMIALQAGTLTTNNQTISASGFNATASVCELVMGSSVLSFSAMGSVWTASANLTVTPGTSTIWLTNTTSSSKTFAGASKTYYDLQFTAGGTGAIIFTGSNTFHAIKRSGAGVKTLTFTDGTTTTLTGGATALPSGTSGNLITLSGTSTGGWTINTTVDIECDYLSVSRLTVTGGGKLYCGTHSTNGGNNNANVIFTDKPAASSGQSFHLGLGLGL